jgi:hypothetical protein
LQYADGRIDLGDDAPCVNVEILQENGISPRQAIELAAVLLEAAIEANRWAGR